MFITLDLVVVDAIRYILSNGGSTVLFLPMCLPLCFIVLMLYSCNDTGKDIKAQKKNNLYHRNTASAFVFVF